MPGTVRVAVRLGSNPDDVFAWLATGAAFDAAGADALWIKIEPASDLDLPALVAALAARTSRSILIVAEGDGLAGAVETIQRIGNGRLRMMSEEGHRWQSAAAPQGRPGWRAALQEAAENGIYGLVIPQAPRLLDLLRNPDDPGDRRDLELAVG